jgi:hypothetical protein
VFSHFFGEQQWRPRGVEGGGKALFERAHPEEPKLFWRSHDSYKIALAPLFFYSKLAPKNSFGKARPKVPKPEVERRPNGTKDGLPSLAPVHTRHTSG